jgi:predicted DNA-binding protein
MGDAFTIRLGDELYAWLKEESGRSRRPMARIIRDHLEMLRASENKQGFLRRLGEVRGGDPRVSSRKGFARK